jgi:hypothetical protein
MPTEKTSQTSGGLDPDTPIGMNLVRDVAKSDAFMGRFFASIPLEICATYTPRQLAAVKRAFAGETGRRHPVDIRLSIPLLVRRFYLVLLMGPERRTAERRNRERSQNQIVRAANLVFLSILIIVVLLALAGMLYMLKSALGIDLFTGRSLGLWDAATEQLKLMFK